MDYATKTYNSIAGAFEFREILNTNIDFMLPYHLGRQNSDLILFLGFPAVGMFYKEKVKQPGANEIDFDMFNDALRFCHCLRDKLYQLCTVNADKLTLRLICFSKNLTKKYLECAIKINILSKEQGDAFQSVENSLHEAIIKLKEKCPRNFRYAFLEKEIGLRFAISKKQDPSQEEENEKASVWVVSDFYIDDVNCKENIKKLSEFQSGGYKTRDPEIIKVLRSLCDNYIDHPQEGFITVP